MDTVAVAKLFCVSLDTVRSWRSPALKDSPLYLTGKRVSHNVYMYAPEDVEAFALRNPRYTLRYLRNALTQPSLKKAA